MWKTLLTVLQNVLTLARDLEESRREIKELNEKIYRLTAVVQRLSDRIDANERQERAEREKLALQLEYELLKSGRETKLLGSKKSAKKRRGRAD
jgi:septal ring factor EnvC (AmiA/AmiB activator)